MNDFVLYKISPLKKYILNSASPFFALFFLLIIIVELHEFIELRMDVDLSKVSFSFDLVLLKIKSDKRIFTLTIKTDSFV